MIVEQERDDALDEKEELERNLQRTKSILEAERQDLIDQKENWELEVETLQRQIEMIGGINEELEAEAAQLKAQKSENTSKEELEKIKEDYKNKSLLTDQLALNLSNIEKEKGQLSDRLNKTLEDYKVLNDMNAELQAALEKVGNTKQLQDELNA